MWPFRNAASTGLVLKPETNAVRFAVATAHRAIMLQQNLGVILLAAAQRAADGIEPEQFRGLNRLWRKMLVLQGASPFRDCV